jgi:hypothetical protein
MNRLDILANDLAFLNNKDMQELARILVRDYPTRADVLETQIGTAFFDSDVNYAKEIAYE